MSLERHMHRACVHTLGCRLNQYETAVIEDRLRAAGWEVVPFGEPADLGIINTCTVTGEADAKCRQAIRAFVRKNPGAFTAVVGCYAELAVEALARLEGVDLVLGTEGKLDVLEYVAEGKNGRPRIVREAIAREPFVVEPCVTHPSSVTRRTNLKIQDGCDSTCSYCVVPLARGRARSRRLDNILEEARRLIERGAKELVITGVNVGRYNVQGRLSESRGGMIPPQSGEPHGPEGAESFRPYYGGYTIVDVIERLNALEGVRRLRISSIEPTTIPEALLDMMDAPDHALVPYLHIPVQSGSDRVLALMKRPYTRREVQDFLSLAHGKVRDLCIGTDILVGTPGETEGDFEETVRFLEESPVAYAHVFKYSERPGTIAARLPDKVDPNTRNARSARIRRISEGKRRRFLESHLGRRMEVLFECREDGFWAGYTGNYIRVRARFQEDVENQTRLVTLLKVEGERIVGQAND